MFGGGDPFGDNPFRSVHRQMRAMDNMMNTMMNDAFTMLDGFGGGFNQPMITNGMGYPPHHDGGMMIHPFGGFFGPSFMSNMMGQVNNVQQRAMNDPNSLVFSQSTMISYDGSGAPKVIQESTRKAGNAKETRRAVKDEQGDHLSVGHSIGDRSHIIEKKRDKYGRVKQQQQFVNLDQDEAELFNNEFKSQATNFFGHPSTKQIAIEGSKRKAKKTDNRRSNETSTPIVTIPDDEDEPFSGGGERYYKNRPEERTVYSNNGFGPIIREIDEEADSTNAKRRKGIFGKFVN